MTEPETLLAHRDFVRALARALLRDPNVADDVEQETWAAALRHPRGAAERGWLATCVRNFARQWHRSEMRRGERERSASAREGIPSVADVVAREESRRIVVAAVLALDAHDRDVLLLRFYESLPPREIARRLGLPTETVRTRVKRGLERLRVELARRGAGEGESGHGGLAWLVPFAGGGGLRAAPPLLVVGKLAAVAATLLVGALFLGLWRTRVPEDNAAIASLPVVAAPATFPESDAGAVAVTGAESAVAAVDLPSRSEEPIVVTRPLHGRVVTSTGEPVAGARVFAWPDYLDAPILLDGATPLPPHASQTTSGSDGRFYVEVASTRCFFTLFAEASGFSPTGRMSAGIDADVTIPLAATCSLSGRVTTLAHEPVAGALVRWLGMFVGSGITRETTAGPDGSYRFDDLPADDAGGEADSAAMDWWVEVRADGFAPLLVDKDRRGSHTTPLIGVTTLDLVVVGGATVRGRVVDAESLQTVAGARVLLFSTEGSGGYGRAVGGGFSSLASFRRLAQMTTGEDGNWLFPHVPSKGFHESASSSADRNGVMLIGKVVVLADGFAPAAATISLADDGATVEIDVPLERPAGVRGVIVDETGEPIAGAKIYAFRLNYPNAWFPSDIPDLPMTKFLSGPDGSFEIAGIPASTKEATAVELSAGAEGFARTRVSVLLRAGETAVVPDLVLNHAPAVLVTVVDPDGVPLPDAIVSTGRYRISVHRTDAEGAVRFVDDGIGPPVPPDFRLNVSRPGHGNVTTDPIVPDAANPPSVRIVLPPERSLAGRVVDRDGKPVADATVRLYQSEATWAGIEAEFTSDPTDGFESLRRPEFKKCDTDGRFLFDTLPEGSVNLFAYIPLSGSALPDGRLFVVGVTPGPKSKDLVLPVSATSRANTVVTGTVHYRRTGAALADPFIVLSRERDGRFEQLKARLSEPGTFRFDDVPEGMWQLGVATYGYAPQRREVVVSASAPNPPFELLLGGGAVVDGKVHRADGVTDRTATVYLESIGDGPVLLATVAAADRFRFDDVPPGRYVVGLQVGEPEHSIEALRHPQEISIDADTRELTLELESVTAGLLRLTVDRPARSDSGTRGFRMDEPPSGLRRGRIQITTGDGTRVRSIEPEGIGCLCTIPLPPGHYRLRLEWPGEEPQQKQVTVAINAPARGYFIIR